MQYQKIVHEITQLKSYLCVGLDTDIQKIPTHLLQDPDPMFSFNKAIIDATADCCVAYKINTAFYEAQGSKGWETMQKTLDYIPENKFTIADAKRGDIGNTVDQYAKAFFEQMNFDSITVAPYMGQDSVSPFLKYKDKWVILLALTSNTSSSDFQLLFLENKELLFENVLKTSLNWATKEQMMYVVGATQTNKLQDIRKIAPHHFLLVPGVGTQGGSLEEVSKYALSTDCGLLVNASRSIIYASDDANFAQSAQREAQKIQKEMEIYLDRFL
jgi:orotidine-5'-phosphate decarboxylase